MLKSVEMKQQLEKLNQQAKELLEKEDAKLEDIEALYNEIETLQAKIKVQEKLEEEEKNKVAQKDPVAVMQPKENEKKKFINALRNKFKNIMREGAGEDGGYTVPQDIQTRINELRESKDALRNYVTVEPVSTVKGSRVFKKRAQLTGFVEVAEGGEIPETAYPQFTLLEYHAKKYAGFMKATNELLNDSDQAIEDFIVRWLGDEGRVTDNKLILAELSKKEKKTIATLDDIKDIMNVELDPAFHNTTVVLTNQDGFNWLDKQKDNDGNYLLQPSATSPTGKQLFGKNVIVVSNKDLPSTEVEGVVKAPIFIGDLKEAIVVFDRQQLEVRATDVGSDAFLTDTTVFRAILRQDVKTHDEEAYVHGEIEIAPVV